MIDIEVELNKFLKEINQLGRSVLDLIEIEYLKKDFLKLIDDYVIDEFSDSEVGEWERKEAYDDGFSDGSNAGYAEGYDQCKEDMKSET